MIPNYSDVFKLPLKLYYSKVFSDNRMAFDFAMKMLYKNAVTLTPEIQETIVSILNKEDAVVANFNVPTVFAYENGIIYVFDNDGNKREFIILRGWGMLTGTGGDLHLKPEDAAKIQDDFAEYIMSTLKAFKNK